MNSEESCDTEDWSNDAENTVLITGINYILKYIQTEKLFQIVIIFHNIIVLLYFWSNKCSFGKHKGPCTPSPKFWYVFIFYFFSDSSSFPIKMLATGAKTQKIEPGPIIFYFLWRTEFSEAVCKCDWHNMRSYLFFNVRKFQMRILDLVCKDL